MKTKSLMISTLCLVCAMAWAQPTVDGTINPAEYNAYQAALQTLQTEFGDNAAAGVDDNSGGSELCSLSIADTTTYVYFGIAGNMEMNGNQVIILMDADNNGATGVNVIPTGGYGTLEGLTLPTGFGLDCAIAPNAGGNPSMDLYMNFHCYPGGVQKSNYLGTVPDSGAGVPTAGQIVNDLGAAITEIPAGNRTFPIALNNANTAGVAGGTALIGVGEDPAAVTTGLEVGIERELLEDVLGAAINSGAQMKVLVILTGSDGKYMSNQLLPGFSYATGNPGNAATVNLSSNTFVTYTFANSTGAAVEDWSLF